MSTTPDSMMYAVMPVPFAPAQIVSTTATNAQAAWAAGTYALGATVTHTAPASSPVSLHVWESLTAGNTTVPGADPLTWLDLDPANTQAMFDRFVSTQTTAASPLVVVLQPGTYTSNIALLNLVGTSATVEMLVSGTPVYTATIDLQGAEIASWWDYYFAPDEQITRLVLNDLPMHIGHQLRITLTGTGNVAIGQCIYGTRQDLGALQYGATASVIDYSRKTTDDFGVTTFVERDYADEFGGQLSVENTQLNRIKRILRKLRATPTVYVGSDDDRFRELFVAYGWVRSHRVAVQYPSHALLDVEIGALT